MRQLKITQQITSRETIAVSKYLQEVSTIPLLTIDEELALPAKIKEGDARALKRFVEGNLRFVVSVAKQYQGSGEKLDDLISAGNEGLIEAAKRFDTTRGFKFISYAVWWIRQSIQKHIGENSKQIRLPLNKISLVNKIRTVTSQLEQSLQRNPSVEEIRDEVELKFEKVKIEPGDIEKIMASNTPLSSLDMTLGENSESTLSDLLITETLGDVNQTLAQQDLQKTINRILDKKFSDREKNVLKMYFGILGEQKQSLEEIADKFELTRERVRQIKEKGIRRLKQTSSSKELRGYL